MQRIELNRYHASLLRFHKSGLLRAQFESDLAMGKAEERQRIMRRVLTPSWYLNFWIKKSAREARECYSFGSLDKLPTEIVMEIMKKMRLRDLNNAVQANERMRSIMRFHGKHIHLGMQQEQFPYYYRLFGTTGRMTPDQVYHTMIEKENREWWDQQEDAILWIHHSIRRRIDPKLAMPGDAGRIALYSSLVRDIQMNRIRLCDAGIRFGEETMALTDRALALFWRMQWTDRPGLDYLGERTETEDDYVNKRGKLFAAEKLEVRARYIGILIPVARSMWHRLHLEEMSERWSESIKLSLQNQQDITMEDAGSWVRGLAAELIVEVISKVGIRRALRLRPWRQYPRDLGWIVNSLTDKFEELLEETFDVTIQAPARMFEFGKAIGLQPEDVVGFSNPLLSMEESEEESSDEELLDEEQAI